MPKNICISSRALLALRQGRNQLLNVFSTNFIKPSAVFFPPNYKIRTHLHAKHYAINIVLSIIDSKFNVILLIKHWTAYIAV